jgi:hypothetical protein
MAIDRTTDWRDEPPLSIIKDTRSALEKAAENVVAIHTRSSPTYFTDAHSRGLCCDCTPAQTRDKCCGMCLLREALADV